VPPGRGAGPAADTQGAHHRDRDPDRNRHGDSDANADSDANSHSNSDSDRDPNSHTNADRDPDTHTDTGAADADAQTAFHAGARARLVSATWRAWRDRDTGRILPRQLQPARCTRV
jgi:hypothetical protein